MTERRIILHVGSPKCGSTFLQHAMLRNRRMLSKAGISYPHDSGVHPGNAADLATITRTRLDALFGRGHTLVLSHEALYSMPKHGKALSELVAGGDAEVQLVVFLRPFPDILFGDYSQYMKQFFKQFLKTRNPYDGRTFKAFAHQRRTVMKPALFLKGWQGRFPRTEMILSGHRDISAVFDRLLPDAPPLDWNVPRDQSNPSLRMEDCDRLAAAMRDPAISSGTIREMFRKAQTMTDKPDAGKTRIRREMVDAIFADQNQALLTHFGFDNRVPARSGNPARP